MNLSENIKNAFLVTHKTYENVEKLIQYCKTICDKETNYLVVTDKFLRYKFMKINGETISRFGFPYMSLKDFPEI